MRVHTNSRFRLQLQLATLAHLWDIPNSAVCGWVKKFTESGLKSAKWIESAQLQLHATIFHLFNE